MPVLKLPYKIPYAYGYSRGSYGRYRVYSVKNLGTRLPIHQLKRVVIHSLTSFTATNQNGMDEEFGFDYNCLQANFDFILQGICSRSQWGVA